MRLTIEDMQKIAEERGGKCLSTEYINNNTKLKWQCSEGHIWEASSSNIRNRLSWCPYCTRNIKLTIEEMQKIANSRDGKCLSNEYMLVPNLCKKEKRKSFPHINQFKKL